MKIIYFWFFLFLYSCGYTDIDPVPKFNEVKLTDDELFDLCELSSTDKKKIDSCIMERKNNK